MVSKEQRQDLSSDVEDCTGWIPTLQLMSISYASEARPRASDLDYRTSGEAWTV